jgi:hypothetical protein
MADVTRMADVTTQPPAGGVAFLPAPILPEKGQGIRLYSILSQEGKEGWGEASLSIQQGDR